MMRSRYDVQLKNDRGGPRASASARSASAAARLASGVVGASAARCASALGLGHTMRESSAMSSAGSADSPAMGSGHDGRRPERALDRRLHSKLAPGGGVSRALDAARREQLRARARARRAAADLAAADASAASCASGVSACGKPPRRTARRTRARCRRQAARARRRARARARRAARAATAPSPPPRRRR